MEKQVAERKPTDRLGKVYFGKHRGRAWSTVPEDYLIWLAERSTGESRQERQNRDIARMELERRKLVAMAKAMKKRKAKPPEIVPTVNGDRIWFGKHRGELWSDVSTQYLETCVGICEWPAVQSACLAELNRRGVGQ